MFTFSRFSRSIIVAILVVVGSFAFIAYANHSWGGYHWARTVNPSTLKLGDNVSPVWDTYLGTASNDWNKPSTYTTVLYTTVIPGQANPKSCRPTSGMVEVCNNTYGNNGWLGIAQIWASGNHITQGTVKLNDTYFNTTKYNTSAWKQFVTCQEVGHTFGLDHQDINFTNPNLGTCMDYTNDPSRNDGLGINLQPNAHDYEELGIIYTHLDNFTTIFGKTSSAAAADIDTSNPSEWGKVIRKSSKGRTVVYERDLGNGHKVFTFVIWADQIGTE